ncbi:MAG TPA: hypothetical protein DET40_16085 [Lentisphaeria bacterium]|nr:MAG: hypothetical protein A2X45_22450 [Lentisphaerae bacterium GWF2_50_93]HCE45060.1 hypothetical protein [Lentisphaeria bacterium]
MEENGNTVEAGGNTSVAAHDKCFYDIDSSRVTLKEYSWETPFFLLPLAMILKLFRVKIPSSTDDPPVRDLEPFEIQELPEPEMERLSVLKCELDALGFSDPVCHRIEDPLHAALTDWITLRHVSGKAFARIHYRSWNFSQKTKAKLHLFPVFYTEFEDGHFVCSSAGKPDTLEPPSWVMDRKINLPAARLWDLHQKSIEKEGGVIRLVNNPRDLRQAIRRQHEVVTGFHLKRGVFAEVSGNDKLRISQALASGDGMGMSIDDGAVISEIRRLEVSRSSWASLILVAAVTLALFISLGATQQPLRFLLLVVAVLFVHEMGHFIVMKIIGYRNMRMFFIPFLGAAVSGQNYNVAGWKQVVVSLAGPLPGIALGVAAGIAGTIADNALIKDFALMLLILNGFNLLPLMPLDGGRVMDLVLFCRHPVLNVFSRVLAALAFLGLGIAVGDKIIGAIGIFIAIGIPMTYKTSKITDRLRKQNLCTAVSGSASIPDELALKILGEVQSEFPKGLNIKSKAQMTVSIYGTLNARPPNWIASFIFVFILFSSFMVAVVSASLMYVAKNSDFGNFIDASVNRPEMAYKVGTAKVWRGPSCPAIQPPSNLTLAANYRDSVKAEENYSKLQRSIPAESSAVLFGQSVALNMPYSGEKDVSTWLNKIERDGASEAFAVRDGFDLQLSLSFLMPTLKSSEDLKNELTGYFAFCGHEKLIPPWSPSWDVEKKEIQDFRRARETYGRLSSFSNKLGSDAETENQELKRKTKDALRRGDSKEMEKIEKRQMEIRRENQKRHMENIRSSPEADLEVVNLYQKWLESTDSKDKSAELRKSLAACMGIGESSGGDKAGPATAANGGYASKEGLLFNVTCSSFNSTPEGLEAISKWLEKLKVRDVKYNIFRYRHYDDDDMEE